LRAPEHEKKLTSGANKAQAPTRHKRQHGTAVHPAPGIKETFFAEDKKHNPPTVSRVDRLWAYFIKSLNP